MQYPTLEQVQAADQEQLCRWRRFLHGPGVSRLGQPDFNETLLAERKILDLIMERSKQLGGFTPEISKAIGWGE